MDHVFPIGLPGPTAFYTTLYVLTFALHQALVHYVLAGSLYVAWRMIRPGTAATPPVDEQPTAVLRDWMPFVLSAAITAGVAPLLFVQILYQREFYTASLLLPWRWIIVIPVLIAAFYLLYLLKSRRLFNWAWLVRVAIPTLAGVAFVFVGFCWTVNFLLSVSEIRWPDVYANGALPFDGVDVTLRMLVWCGGSFASMATILAWQLVDRQQNSGEGIDPDPPSWTRPLSTIALGGLAVAVASGTIYLWRADAEPRGWLFGVAGGPHLAAVAVGVAAYACGWSLLRWQGVSTRPALTLATLGWLIALVSVSAMRELGRLAALDIPSLAARHASAAEVGGLAVFLVFAVLNLFAIAGCIWIVRRSS